MDASATPPRSVTVPSTDGVFLAVHDLGGEGRPLLWAHATGFHGRVWRSAAAHFPDRRNLALDFRGYGDSTAPPPEELDWLGFGDDVLAVIDHFDLTDVQAVGHSKGGAALLMAAVARPDAFDRLAVYEPIVFPPMDGPPGENHLAAVTRHRRVRFDSYEDAIERFGSKPPLGSLHPDVLDDYVRFGFRTDGDGVVLKADREHEARTYELGSTHPTFAKLPEADMPVLVMAGADGGAPAQIAPLVAAKLPRATEQVFGDLGHFGPLEDPERFAGVVREFLDAPTS